MHLYLMRKKRRELSFYMIIYKFGIPHRRLLRRLTNKKPRQLLQMCPTPDIVYRIRMRIKTTRSGSHKSHLARAFHEYA